jgi:hypothetical protein
VLFVADQEFADPLLDEALQAEIPGAEICRAHTLREADRLTASGHYLLFIIDMPLPENPGRDLLRAIRLGNPAAQILILGPDPWITELKMPGLHRLESPVVNPLELIDVVRTCCQRASNAAAMMPAAGQSNSQFNVLLCQLSPVDVIQLKCLAMATTALDFAVPDGRKGRLWLERGEIVHAETGALRGEAAVEEMVHWRTGDIVEMQTEVVPQYTIDLHWQSLLMQAMQALDESDAATVVV